MRHTTHTNNCNDLEVVRAMCYEVPDWRIFIYNFFKEGISYKDLNSNIAMTYKQMVGSQHKNLLLAGLEPAMLKF